MPLKALHSQILHETETEKYRHANKQTAEEKFVLTKVLGLLLS